MEDELELYQSAAEEQMQNAVAHLDDVLQHIRAGKANPRILDPIKIDYYGAMSPLANCATITTPDARTIAITPWEKKLISEITYDEVIRRGLKVMDQTATVMCKENGMPIYVFNMDQLGNLEKVINGEPIGTLVKP